MAMESVIFSELTSRDNKLEIDKLTYSLDAWYNLDVPSWPHKQTMHRTQRNLTVFAIILTELCSSLSTIYHPHAFAPEDNQQKYSEILQEKYHGIIIIIIISFRIISKHFKMYITINDIKGEKRIDLSYSIDSDKEIAVIIMHSNNSQNLSHRFIEVLLKMGKKIVLNKGVYTDKEINSLIGMELKSRMLDSCNDILRTNKLERITKMIISLNELNNSNNLEDGRPSNILFTYYVTSS